VYYRCVPLPQVGETWVETLGGSVGIVTQVNGTLVTFTSLTGVRAAIEFNRSYVSWELRAPRPERTQACSWKGCANPAFLQYTRPLQDNSEVVCPTHVPMGVHSTVLEEPVASAWIFRGELCQGCQIDAVEILGETSNALPTTTMWTCSRCGSWWVRSIHPAEDFEAGHLYQPGWSPLVPDGYTARACTQQHDPLSRNVTLRISVRRQVGTRPKGAKPLNLFDHLIRETSNKGGDPTG
jgi:hypothetical protein